ncbi:MAG TPA: mechanosensitive ion channel family protein [Terrimesophilobacter sp.]|nr:mechanosensitive ion channel family protein [Terrimesophilobacter sp.]HRQ00944.1 mechanosensitive ion channel family protein [Terrimesophilobacter sp.]
MPLDIDWASWSGTLIAIAIALVGVAIALLIFRIVTIVAARRAPWVRSFYVRIRSRFIVFLTVGALWAVSALTAPQHEAWWPAVAHVFLIVQILTGAWLLSAVVTFGITRAMERFDEADTTAEVRRMRTQLSVVRRLVAVLVAVIAVGAVLFTFPEVQAIGTSILASAGIVSIVAGLAAQTTLGNLIAGIQIAFSDSVRVGDVVVVEGEWGRIGEITLSYVVVYIWDERRLVLPCTYFTTQPFEVWTRKSDRVLGTVYMDLDWRVPVDAVRAKFDEIMERSDDWDRRTSSVLVTGSQGGMVTVRFLVSAADSGAQWRLRCLVREQMMSWLQQEHPEALPTTRVHLEQPLPA